MAVIFEMSSSVAHWQQFLKHITKYFWFCGELLKSNLMKPSKVMVVAPASSWIALGALWSFVRNSIQVASFSCWLQKHTHTISAINSHWLTIAHMFYSFIIKDRLATVIYYFSVHSPPLASHWVRRAANFHMLFDTRFWFAREAISIPSRKSVSDDAI